MLVHTIVSMVCEEGYAPEVAGFWQFSGKSGKRQAEKQFKRIAAKILECETDKQGRLDMADHEAVEEAWMSGECKSDYCAERFWKNVQYFKQTCRGK